PVRGVCGPAAAGWEAGAAVRGVRARPWTSRWAAAGDTNPSAVPLRRVANPRPSEPLRRQRPDTAGVGLVFSRPWFCGCVQGFGESVAQTCQRWGVEYDADRRPVAAVDLAGAA